MTNQPPSDTQKNARIGIVVYIRIFMAFVLQAVCFFAAAGTLNVPRGWYFFGFILVYMVPLMFIFMKQNPQLVKARLKPGADTKPWDKIIVPVFLSIQYFGVMIVAGLDVGRYHWSSIDVAWMLPGFVVMAFSVLLTHFAMRENPHFESTVRIQTDRDHKVISTGPYKYVRHPGYVGALLWTAGVPLVLGSAYSFIPSGIVIVLLVIRTALEDATLQKELPGYREFTQKTRYRLIPGIW